jgi:hypothetical protein
MVANIAQRGLPDYTGQSGQTGSGYALAIDAAMQVFARVARAFAPHASESGSPSAPDMTVTIDAGALLVGESLVSQAAQTSGTLTAPSGNPRRDLIVIDEKTGALSIVTGTEAASPSDPTLPIGKIAVGRIRLTVGMTAIDDMDIDDLRPLWLMTADLKGDTITPVVEAGSPTGCGLTLPAIGSYFVVDFSGSPSLPPVIGISSRPAGRRILLRAQGSGTFAHLGNLILAEGADKTLDDGELIEFVSDGAGVWREHSPAAGLPAANQAEMEAATGDLKAVTPGNAKYHPGVSKVNLKFNGTGTIASNYSHNVSGLTDNGTGDYTVSFATAFSGGNAFSCAGAAKAPNGGTATMRVVSHPFGVTTHDPGFCRINTTFVNATSEDCSDISLLLMGDQ